VPIERRPAGAGRPLRNVPSLPSTAAARPRPPARPARPTPAVRPGSLPAPPLLALLLWPVLVTLGVTLLRLVGELRGWSPGTFSRLPGGGLSPLGIAWLPPAVGFYLGWRLERSGRRLLSPARAFVLPPAAALGGWLVAWAAGRLLHTSWTANLALWAAVSLVVAAVAVVGWPAAGRPLLAYAYAARLPVAVVAALAIRGAWGTHYDAPPPGFPLLRPLARWLWTGLLPQATMWVAWTLALGVPFAALGWLLASRASRRPR
jgi:hypothetical protein